MSYRNLGPNVSQAPQAVTAGGGQYTGEDHSFESIVFQQNKPATDWEMNLLQEIIGSYGLRSAMQKILPTCFLNSFTDRADILGFYMILPALVANANKFQTKSADLLVNGWNIKFDYSDSSTSGVNNISVPSPPTTGSRTDLVILEIWRALVSPSPSVDNKSSAGQILRHGNAKAPDAPSNANLADDLIDPTFAKETSRRIQIQYRYRVISGVDVYTYYDGVDDPTVVANTVPYLSGSTVDGSATAYAYTKHASDPGLWTAGNGDATSATDLGTADGIMYSIPVCAVFRRNSTAFDRSSNLNGAGLIASSISGRPDGLYADQIIESDILDLRRGVAWDLGEVLDKTVNEVLDSSLSTSPSSTIGGHTQLWLDSLATTGSHTGPTDGIRRYFGDRSFTESVVAEVSISASSTFNIDLASFPHVHLGTLDLTLDAPVPTIVGISKMRLQTISSETDLLASASAVKLQSASITSSTTLSVTLSSASTGNVYVELLLEYPTLKGLTYNIVSAHAMWTPPAADIGAWVDPSVLTATSDAQRYQLDSNYWWVSVGHREAALHLKSTSQNWSIPTNGETEFYVPDIIISSTLAATGYSIVSQTINTEYTKVVVSPATPVGGTIIFTYEALRPAPPLTVSPNDSYDFFYLTRAPQTVPVPSGNQNLRLIPRAYGKNMYVITGGSGSPDNGFPFDAPGTHLPVSELPVLNYPEGLLDTPTRTSIGGYEVAASCVQLTPIIPYVPNPGEVVLHSDGGDTTTDAEGRSFWPRSGDGVSSFYTPYLESIPTDNRTRRKVVYPVLMEVKENVPSSAPYTLMSGTLVLVIFTRWAEFSDDNKINLLSTPSDACAAVYRLRGNLLPSRKHS